MILRKALLILPLTLALSGCVIVTGNDWDEDDDNNNWRAIQKQNRQLINQLSLGELRSEIVSRMGNPAFNEAFTADNGSSYQVLFYRTQHEHGDGETTKDETTALVFENEKLIGWGNDALQRIQ